MLCSEVLDDLNSNNHTDQQEEITIDQNIINEHANLKTGINLPKKTTRTGKQQILSSIWSFQLMISTQSV